MKPTKSILDPSRPYVPSHLTNVAATIARVRAEQAAAAAHARAGIVPSNVQTLKRAGRT